MPTIHRAVPEDAPAMRALQQRAFAEEGRRSGSLDLPPLTEPLDAIAAHVQTQTALLARQGDALVGTIRGIVTDGACLIRALAIDPAHQGQGIGSMLLKALELAHPQAKRFDLTTNTVMEGNVPFYERHGYHVTALRRVSDRITLADMSKAGHAGRL